MYDKAPFIDVGPESECFVGWEAIASSLREYQDCRICVECYPGVFIQEILGAISQHMPGWKVILAEDALLPEAVIEERFTNATNRRPGVRSDE